MGVADHVEQRAVLFCTVDHPVGIEDLVAAVLGIGLREHHQLDVGGVAREACEVIEEIVDLVIGEREAEFPVGCLQRGPPAREHIDAGQFARRNVTEQLLDLAQRHHRFGHAVVQQRQQLCARGGVEGASRGIEHEPGHAALDAAHAGKAAVMQDVGRLR